MHLHRTLDSPSDRTVNRLIIGSLLVLAVGIPILAAIYLTDRFVDPGPPFAERQVAALEQAVRASPNTISLRLQLAGAYVAARRYPDAVRQFDEVLRVDRSSRTAHLGRGNVLLLEGDLDAAAKEFQAVVDLAQGGEFALADVELHEAWYNLGSIALRQGKAADAIPPLNQALKIRPTDADTLHLLGSAYLETGQLDRAVESLRSAVLFVPLDWSEPYAALERTYTRLGATAEAAWAGAMVELCQGHPDVARKRLAGLVDGPAATDALLGLAMIAEKAGDRAGAADLYRRVLERDSGNFNARVGLGRVGDAAPGPASPTSDPAGSS